MKYLALFSLAVIGFALAPLEKAEACSCIPSRTPEAEMEFADAVFSGRVISVDEPAFPDSTLDPVSVRFKTLTSWKGVLTDEAEVRTAISSASCGYPFEENKEYIVYATEEEDGLSVSLCSRTALLADASEDVEKFGRGITPQDVRDSEVAIPTPLLPAKIAAGVLIGLGVGAWLVFKVIRKAE